MEDSADLGDVALAVLAGGEGSRMGRPKAEIAVGGRPVLEFLLDRLDWPGPTLLVTAPGREHPPGWQRFTREASDPVAGHGPLRGLLTALEGSPVPHVVMTAVDMPLVRRRGLAWLVTVLKSRPGLLGVMTGRRTPAGATRVEPFPSAFRVGAAGLVREMLAQDRRALHPLAERPGVLTAPVPPDWPANSWTNLNFPHDLEALAMADFTDEERPEKLPGTYKQFVARFPALGKAHEEIAKAVDSYGPLDRKTCELVKIGLSVGAGLETATRSHVRRAMQHGATEAEIEQAVLLAYNTCGFPRMVMAWQWARQQIERGV